jgi:hypothetical protein
MPPAHSVARGQPMYSRPVRAVAVAFVLAGLAIAVNGVEATPSEAAASALTLSVEQQTYVIPSGRLRTYVPVGFRISGGAGRRVEVWHCRNGHYGPSDVWLSWPQCSSNDSVFGQPMGDSWVDEFGDAGRYQSFARTTDELSNFVTFTVLDECRWTVIRDAQRFGHSEPGMPYHCNHLRNGPLELRAADGSRLISTGYGSAARNQYGTRLSNPDLGFGIGTVHNWPTNGSLRLKLGRTLGNYLVHVETQNGMIATFGRTDFRVSHQRRLTRVRVYAGKVIVTAAFAADLFLGEWVEKVCKGQVSFRCLKKLPRTLTLKAGQSRKIRAG